MKVGIITRHAVANYGSILQAYATERIFKKLGYESKIIDYIREDEKTKNQIMTNANASKTFNKNKFTKILYSILQGKNIEIMNKKFEKFRKNFLDLTKECNNEDDLKKLKNEFDIFCTGSDQVWGKIGNDDFDSNYFLKFVDSSKKCISYSASFGKTVLNKELINNIRLLTSNYNKILVREDTAKKILIENGITNVEQVLDPTLLLTKEDWDKIISTSDNKISYPYIFVYQLHHNKKFEEYTKYVERKLKIPVYRVNPSIYFKMKPGKFIYLPTPNEFLNLIKNSKYVLTDSFHGTVFSIIFKKNFIDFLPEKTGTRIVSLLKLLKLDDRIISDYDSCKILCKNIDYEPVDKVLEKERNKSINLLKGVLDEK